MRSLRNSTMRCSDEGISSAANTSLTLPSRRFCSTCAQNSSALSYEWSTYQYDSQAFLYRVRDALQAVSTVRLVGARAQAVRFFSTDAPWVDVAPVCALWNTSDHRIAAWNRSKALSTRNGTRQP